MGRNRVPVDELRQLALVATQVRQAYAIDHETLRTLFENQDDATALAELQRLTKLKRWH